MTNKDNIFSPLFLELETNRGNSKTSNSHYQVSTLYPSKTLKIHIFWGKSLKKMLPVSDFWISLISRHQPSKTISLYVRAENFNQCCWWVNVWLFGQLWSNITVRSQLKVTLKECQAGSQGSISVTGAHHQRFQD